MKAPKNKAYDEEEKRGFVKLNAITLLFTLGGIILSIIYLALVVSLPALVGNLGLPSTLQTVTQWGRWLVLAIFVMLGLA
nr:YhjD/YihY/BrkB family envelope integrity protein [Pontibacter diazotrophicus]